MYQDVNLIIRRDEPNGTVFKFPSIGELRQKLLQNMLRKFDKITQSRRVCIQYFDDKDVHGFNIHTNPDGTTYTMSDYNTYCKLFYCTSSCIITKIKSMLKMILFLFIIFFSWQQMLWSGVGSCKYYVISETLCAHLYIICNAI